VSARRSVRRVRRSLPFVFALLAAAAAAQESIPIAARYGVERVRLPQGEHMGLAGAALLFDVGHDWSLGPSIYGAASGERGGFFVGGLEVQRRWAIAPHWALTAGLYAGGGGGAGAPVGGGLMWRPSVSLMREIGASWEAGLSWSSVRFPSGEIASQQLGVVLGWRGEFRESGRGSGLGFDRFATTAMRYRLDDGRRIGLVGARAEHPSSVEGVRWGVEAAAAAQGDAAGYMELLGAASYDAPLGAAVRAGLRASAGLGGGGAVPSGGGVITKLVGTLQWRFAPGWTIGADVGEVWAANGPLRARQAGVWIATALEPEVDGAADRGAVRTEWVGVLQHHARIERRDGTRGSLETIGLKLNRYVGEHVYLSGQAHSAYAGGAGAYSVGLVGVGIATAGDSRWRGGAELLVGAAGGGGVVTAGGALAQAMLWAGWSPTGQGEWRAGIGALRPWRGGGVSPSLELAWSRSFALR
jgi:hypothetical protein